MIKTLEDLASASPAEVELLSVEELLAIARQGFLGKDSAGEWELDLLIGHVLRPLRRAIDKQAWEVYERQRYNTLFDLPLTPDPEIQKAECAYSVILWMAGV